MCGMGSRYSFEKCMVPKVFQIFGYSEQLQLPQDVFNEISKNMGDSAYFATRLIICLIDVKISIIQNNWNAAKGPISHFVESSYSTVPEWIQGRKNITAHPELVGNDTVQCSFCPIWKGMHSP